MYRAVLVAASFVVFLWAEISRAAAPGIYSSAAQEFSVDRGNPNGVWTYGSMAGDFSTFTPYAGTLSDANNNPVWYQTSPPAIDHTPCVWFNTTTSTIYGAAPNQLVLHPSNTFQPSVVRWTAPAPGFYRIKGRFYPGDSGQMAVGIRREKYNRFLWSGSDSGSFDLFFTTDVDNLLSFYMTGETVDFVVYGGYGSGNTPLDVEIIRQTPPVPTYDAAAEYGIYQGNPNGAWSYGWRAADSWAAPLNPYSGYREMTIKGLQWYRTPASPDFTPCIWRNDDAVTHSGVAPGQLSLHPSSTFEESVLRWTAPYPGYYKVFAHFYPGDVGRMKVAVRGAGTSGNVYRLSEAEDSLVYEDPWLTFRNAGEAVEFVVSGGYGSGNTPIEAVIVAQPGVGDAPRRLRQNDATAEFGTDRNPNGVWTYGWMPTNFATFTPFTGVTPQSPTSPGSWWRSALFGPIVWRSNLAGLNYGVAPGALSFHPNNAWEASVLRFTAPADGTYAFHSRFLSGDVGLMRVGIRQGGEWLWRALDSGSVHLTRALKAGDAVDFAVYGGYGSGNTPLELTVTPPVQTPTLSSASCTVDPDRANSPQVSIAGSCEPGTQIWVDHAWVWTRCRDDGSYSGKSPWPVGIGTNALNLRGVQSGRPPSSLVPFQVRCIPPSWGSK